MIMNKIFLVWLVIYGSFVIVIIWRKIREEK